MKTPTQSVHHNLLKRFNGQNSFTVGFPRKYCMYTRLKNFTSP